MKKLASLLIVVSLLISCAACSESKTVDENKPKADSSDTAAGETEEGAETEYRYYEQLPKNNLYGMKFRIISRITDKGHDVQHHTDYGNDEIDAEELDGSQINDTVFNRNRELESRYNFVFISIQKDGDPMETVKTSVLANSDDYDAVVDGLMYMADYSMYYVLDNLKYLDLSASCWDQNANGSLSFSKKHYIAVGDMLTLDKKATWCLLFNKKLAADHQFGNLYDIVRSGGWTMDAFYELAKRGSGDLNGDGRIDETDNWGFLTEDYNINVFIFGGGVRFTKKDELDHPMLDLYNDHTVAVFEKAFKINADYELCLNLSKSRNGPLDCNKAFAEDRGLFYMTGIATAMEFRYMDSDFGILPAPKYDEAQKQYYTALSKWNAGCIAVPMPITRPDEIGFILQATCLASTHTLKSTFYNTVLHGITIRDEESRDMLDIIFSNRVFDLIFINNWGEIGDMFFSLMEMNSDKFASMYRAKEKKILTAIDIGIDKYLELEQ